MQQKVLEDPRTDHLGEESKVVARSGQYGRTHRSSTLIHEFFDELSSFRFVLVAELSPCWMRTSTAGEQFSAPIEHDTATIVVFTDEAVHEASQFETGDEKLEALPDEEATKVRCDRKHAHQANTSGETRHRPSSRRNETLAIMIVLATDAQSTLNHCEGIKQRSLLRRENDPLECHRQHWILTGCMLHVCHHGGTFVVRFLFQPHPYLV